MSWYEAWGKEGDAETEKPVGPHFEENGGQENRSDRRRLGVGVGQPGVEREHGDLDGEGQAEGQEEPDLQVQRQRKLVKLQKIEGVFAGLGPVLEVENQNGGQHEDAADHGVDEEFHGGVDAPLRVPPDPDQQVHGNQHHFPENVKKEKVKGDENPDHARLQEEEADHELLDLVLDILPAGEDRDDGEKSREENQEEADAVDAQEIEDPVFRNPGDPFHELHGRRIQPELEEEGEGEEEFQESHNQGDPRIVSFLSRSRKIKRPTPKRGKKVIRLKRGNADGFIPDSLKKAAVSSQQSAIQQKTNLRT